MNLSPPPGWLAAWQALVGGVLRTPLDRSSGHLRAPVETYPDAAVTRVSTEDQESGRQRLAVYNRQYWFRLFTVLQDELPLTAALLGYWHFNGVASDFLRSHPPHHYDLSRVADGFDAFLEGALGGEGVQVGPRRLDRALLLEAARIDLAYRQVFMAPHEGPLVLTAADAELLPRSRLVMRRSVAIVDESAPLVVLRDRVLGGAAQGPIEPPKPYHQGRRSWLLRRAPQGLERLPLAPVQAQLLKEVTERPLSAALAELEASCSDTERADLARHTEAWFSDSMRMGIWSTFERVSA